MTGPEHYKAAEEIYAKAQLAGAKVDGASAVLYIQAAQFHATMALAAATAGAINPSGLGDAMGWRFAISPEEET